jgi:TolA-binding protein
MQFLKLGATAIATGVLTALTMAPALAQQPIPLTKQIIAPLNEARAAIIAKDWPTAKAKLAASTAQAKTPTDKLAIEKLTIVMATQTKDSAEQIRSLQAMLSSGLLTPDEKKQYKGAIAGVYAEAGDAQKSNAAFREFIDEYGGTAEQYAAVGNEYLKQKDFPTAITYGNKAIDAVKATGGKAPEPYYHLLMRAHKESNDMDKYYAVEEQLVGVYPKELYWKELIAARTQDAPGYGGLIRLDMFRAMQAANIPLSAQEKRTASAEALKRGLPAEAIQILEPAIASGELSEADDKENLKDAKAMLATDKTGLVKEAADAMAKGTGLSLANIGEAMLSHGDNAKAIELIQKGIERGISDAGELDIAKLHLGIAQSRSGQKDAARATWATIKSDNGSAVLAKNWTLISTLLP